MATVQSATRGDRSETSVAMYQYRDRWVSGRECMACQR